MGDESSRKQSLCLFLLHFGFYNFLSYTILRQGLHLIVFLREETSIDYIESQVLVSYASNIHKKSKYRNIVIWLRKLVSVVNFRKF